MKKIIVYNRLSKPVLNELKEMYDVEYFEYTNPIEDPNFRKALHKAEGIICLELNVNKELLDLAPNLKIVCNVSTGYDNLDIQEMTKRKIMATNTPGVIEDTTADAIFGILLAAARRIPELDNYVKVGKWKRYLTEDEFGVDVHHKTIGIIGMGKIGSLIAQRAHFGFNMNVLYFNRSRKIDLEKKYDATYCNLETLLKESDFVCVMTPLTEETIHLIGKREFNLMKDTAIFINGSRGKTVDEAALIEALEERRIYAAALDVYQNEPVDDNHPLLQMKNVITTPHIGGATHETILKMSQLAAENLIAGLNGETPPSLINGE